jgi:hypothetical protein
VSVASEADLAADPALAQVALVNLLQRAHAGERAAYHAYEGHWRSAWKREERERIREIAQEELDHRRDVGVMLGELGAGPGPWRERALLLIGVVIHVLCRIGGWTGPIGWYAAMDGAGRLEAGNVHEYVSAATLARAAGHEAYVGPLLHMAQVEFDHEVYFYERCASHWLHRVAPGWRRPEQPPSELGEGARAG